MKTQWWGSSVRSSLTLCYIGVTLVVLVLYAGVVFTFVTNNLSNTLDDRLRDDFQWAATMADLQNDGTLSWFDGGGRDTANSPWLQVWSGERVIFRTAAASHNQIPELAGMAERPSDRIMTVQTPRSTVRVLSRRSDVYGRPLVLQVARLESPMRSELVELTTLLVLGLPFAVAMAGVGGYVLARRALAPIERMARRAQAITAASLSDRLPVQNPNDELGRLATVFNETLACLESSFDQRRRFTAHVSHQLRTPLTAMTSVGEVALREDRPGDSYRGVIGSMLEEVDRLGCLVDRLLMLSRAESGEAKLAHDTVDLRELVQGAASQMAVLAEERAQTLTVDIDGSPCTTGDRVVLREAIVNLIDNAIKYTPEGGRLEIRGWETATTAWFEMRDNGPGVPASVRSGIFRRLSETEPSRLDLKGSGLGLSIAKWAVEASHGELTLVPTSSGATFRISLPRVTSTDATTADENRDRALSAVARHQDRTGSRTMEWGTS